MNVILDLYLKPRFNPDNLDYLRSELKICWIMAPKDSLWLLIGIFRWDSNPGPSDQLRSKALPFQVLTLLLRAELLAISNQSTVIELWDTSSSIYSALQSYLTTTIKKSTSEGLQANYIRMFSQLLSSMFLLFCDDRSNFRRPLNEINDLIKLQLAVGTKKILQSDLKKWVR